MLPSVMQTYIYQMVAALVDRSHMRDGRQRIQPRAWHMRIGFFGVDLKHSNGPKEPKDLK
jgi:hypothetical protein